jgi:mRNA interferase YafQ
MAFLRDFRREKRGHHRRDLEAALTVVVSLPAEDTPLPDANRDQALRGHGHDHRECHLKPDLLLICRQPDTEVLQLVRRGLHRRAFWLTAITTVPRAFPPPGLK